MHQPVDLPDNPAIRFIRLTTGEDLVSEVVEIKDDKEEYSLLIHPLKIVYVAGEKRGSIMLSFIEWVFPKISSEQQFKVYPKDILTMSGVSDKMEDYYYETLIKLDKYVSVEDDGIDFGKYQDKEESNEEITEEELEYLNKVVEEMKDMKRKLH